MQINELKPSDVPSDLCARIKKVMESKNLNWEDAIDYLASKVVEKFSSGSSC